MKMPMMVYRTVKTSDGQGGFSVVRGSGRTIWGAIEVYKNELRVAGVDVREAVEIGDEIAITETE